MVNTKDYLNLSALAYVDFESVDKGKTIGSLADGVKDGVIYDGIPCIRLMLKLK